VGAQRELVTIRQKLRDVAACLEGYSCKASVLREMDVRLMEVQTDVIAHFAPESEP